MNTLYKSILKGWKNSLEKYNKLDTWKYEEQLSSLGLYLRSNDDPKDIVRLVHLIRDGVICYNPNVKQLLSMINKVLDMTDITMQNVCLFTKKSNGRIKLQGQGVRFKGETKRLFDERLRFKGNMLLRNFDIETENPKDSRIVRRIVEKRMCQAYHRKNKRKDYDDSQRRHENYWMKRATSFQLYNIGQMENVGSVSRGNSTHWKKEYDEQTGQIVFKKKMAYSSEEEANKAVMEWQKDHPEDKREITAYKCAICKKWHIGHKSDMKECTENGNSVQKVALPLHKNKEYEESI